MVTASQSMLRTMRNCLMTTVANVGCCWRCCRERGARALEERLEMKKVAEAPPPPAAIAAAAAATSLPDVSQQT